jgi:hypothetical protein
MSNDDVKVKETFADPNQQQDSSTVVNLTLDEPRKTVGFKCNKKLWDAFVCYSVANYGSVCHLLEPVIYAILTAKVNLSKTMKTENSPIVIENFTVERVVKRVRRAYTEYKGVREANYFKAQSGVWLHFDGEVNSNGHAVGCQCTLCDPSRYPKRKW